MSEKKPKLLIFDLDFTLWPFWVDTHVTPPFKKGKNNKIVDAQDVEVKFYKDVPRVLKKLHDEGYEIGVASRTSEIRGANQLLHLFDWDKFIKYKEIYPGCKVTHFKKIQSASGVKYEEMIFFDDEHRNIKDLTEVGVFSILVKNGISESVINAALQQYSLR